MKMKKIVATGLVGVLSASALASCGTNSVSLPSDPAKLANYASEKQAALDSYEAKGTLSFAGEAVGQKANMDITYNMIYFKDPMQLKLTMDINAAADGAMVNEDKKMSAEMYFMQEDSNYVMYAGMNMDGETQWQKTTIDSKDEEYKKMFDMLKNGGTDMMKDYSDCFVKNDEKSTDSEVAIDMNITPEKMNQMLEQSKEMMDDNSKKMVENAESTLTGYGMSLDSIFKSMGTITATMTVDKETGCYKKISMDLQKPVQGLADMILGMANTMMAAQGGDDAEKYTATISKCAVDFEYSNYNNATKFELPQEAKDAEEVSANGPTSVFGTSENE